MAAAVALSVSNRLLSVAVALLCIMAAQLAAASCSPEPAPYSARVAIAR